ncbi:MAG: Uma2 family endonuclease [candidate division KSB1 bacterium]|nr:Uma2 family endonuclease [candidate division KSB1 bacterium]MDZ7272477.1 Uma2 family endonuclease [candidate division KSB1 bacterium]MDZ7284499.1 Uma2 family endonuclease [candidate division KSB1 bacterium]MDZ7297105.1 Uma2 family endonuclease [candidate division KSB1 bacterium]MDZ7306553.1 Uma2 family endonuclease [candidate division KSB1 bacterium]
MSAVAVKPSETQTPAPRFFASEAEFAAWCDEDTRADYVDGEVIVMSPQATLNSRQETWFGSLLDLFASKHGLGSVYATGNVQVRLRAGLRRNPDVIRHLVHETHVEGAPDLLVEFVSPKSAIRDWHEKYIEYETAGVREYWIIDRPQQRVAVYSLGEDRRYHPIAPQEGKIHSAVVPGFWIKLEWLWQGPEFDTYAVAKELGVLA